MLCVYVTLTDNYWSVIIKKQSAKIVYQTKTDGMRNK